MQGACEGGWIEASCFRKRCFFLLENRKIGRFLLLCFRVLVPALFSQNPCQDREHPGSLCLPLGSFQAGTKRAAGSAGHPSWSLGLLPLAEGGVKKTRRIQLAWAAGSLRMIFTPVPLASQMTACCHPSWLWGFFGWGFPSAQQFEHQPRLQEVEDMHPPTSPQATPPL